VTASARVVRGACPHDCPDTCALLVGVDAEGRATSIKGDPDHPITAGFLCGKVSNYLERVYSGERLLHPLVRTGAKGEARFRRATWDEALDAAARGVEDAIARHGGASVVPYSYLGTQGLVQGDVMANRLFDAIGGSTLVRTICASAGVAGTMATNGASPEVDPEEWVHARTIVMWGWNPLSTAPHLWRLILEARRRGARLIVVDPFRSRTARVADVHLRPLPGTDAALALGVMRALLDADVVDREWCRANAIGYDELAERLGGESVELQAERCGIPSGDVRELARALALDQPSLIRLGVGAQRHAGAPMAYRTIACIPALAGSWRHRGGGLAYIPTGMFGVLQEERLARPHLRQGTARSLNMSSIGEALTDPSLSPPVAALIVWNSNPAAIAPDQQRVLDGLRRENLFTIVCEQFMTDTAAHADVVLPATTQLEHLDIVWSWGHHYLTLNEPAIAPLGEARPNSEIFRSLARRLGLTDPCFEESDEEMLATALAGDPAGISLALLRDRGYAKIDRGQGASPHAEGGFATPSGKLELRCDRLGEAGLDPLPFYDPPCEVADEQLAARYPLALLTPKTHLFLNSTFANGVRQHAAQPEPYVVIHPDDAGPRRIADGADVRVHNDRGSFTCRAIVSDDARVGVPVSPMGWWNRDYAGGHSPQATTSQRLTVLREAPTFNDNRVEIEPASDARPSA
jgi:anaerobic selenocysteine-containing dehydrogenase